MEGDCGFDPGDDDDGGVFVNWQVEAGREPRDHGYAVRFSRVMEREHEEALGGSPTIPVATAHLLAFLPREVLDHQRRKRLPSNPRGRPIAFSTLLHGDPTRVIESYLGIRKSPANGDFRRLGPWFKEGPLVEPWEIDSNGVPQPIREHRSVEEARTSEYEPFGVRVDNPDAFLSYFMIFGGSPHD